MSKKWELYETGDKLERKRKSCPKCGQGVFLAKHSDRLSCGKCGYTEFLTDRKKKGEGKKSGEKPEEGGKNPGEKPKEAEKPDPNEDLDD